MKTIRTKADLALYGAEPAFSQPLHVGRPNIGNKAVFMEHMGQILENQWLTNNGPMVQEFEQKIAERLGVKHCIAMCNGTIALEIAIRALKLGGEVIVPSWTFVATAHALYWQGITPVFADIDPTTHNLNPAAVERMITPRTTGIIGVHLWGRAAPVKELQDIASAHDLKLIFDAAHAFGSTYQGETIGRFGECEVLSFHATKSFNTFEGGAVVTNDDELANTMRLMRNFGFSGYDNVIHPGTNGKMVEVCAAMGLTNLLSYESVVAANRENYEAYQQALVDIPDVSLLPYNPVEQNSYHYVVVEVAPGCPSRRDDIVNALHAENILARKYFWPGVHKMRPYRDLFPHAHLMLPQTERIAESVIILPTGATLPKHAIGAITDIIRVCITSAESTS